MGCNCATQEQIKKLHEIYGEKNNLKKTNTQKINEFFRFFFTYIILFLILPLLVGFVLYKAIFTKDKRISIRKILKFNKKGIDDAIAKNIIENTYIIESEKQQ